MFFSKDMIKVYKILLMFFVLISVIAVIHVDAWWMFITITLKIISNYSKVIIYWDGFASSLHIEIIRFTTQFINII